MQTGAEGHEPTSWPERLGPYRLEELLGRGGMGEVYRAYDERLDRRVALKQIRGRSLGHPQSRRRFRREARAAAKLNHSAIVQIYDIVEAQDSDWIVMELVEGRTLAERLREGPLPIEQALLVLRDLTGGLEAAHRQGIVHRDLKTENVMLTAEGQVKILDFGLAKQLVNTDAASSLSLEGTLLGTARAMAPEQALGKAVDHRSDLFSLGTLSYEMVTGKSPFLAPTAVETAIRVCSHRQTAARQHNPAIPGTLSELIDQLLEKEPSRRPANATAVLTALDQVEGGRDSETHPSVDTTVGVRPPTLSLFDVARGELSLGDVERGSSTPDIERASSAVRLRHERRQITVLCCDLVGIGEAAGPLDPEDFYDVAQRFRRLADAVAGPYGGYLVPASDHRLILYFGYPKGGEGAPSRAVRAAMALMGELESRHRRSGELDEPLAMRAAIHTGPAVVRTGAPPESGVILAQTMDLATGLLRQASPGMVILSGTCREGLDARFKVEPLPALQLRGFDRPLPVYRPLEVLDGDTERRRRFQEAKNGERRSATSSSGRPDVPFVGRDVELKLLQDRWQRALGGIGQAVAVTSDPGTGSTRLMIELVRASAAAGGKAQGETEPAGRWLVSGAVDDERKRGGALVRRLLRRLRARAVGPIPAIETFLQAEASPAPAESVLDELLVESRRAPLALVLEDLHAADGESLDWIGNLLQRAVEGALFVVVTYRPGLAVPWGEPRHLTRVALPPLTDAEGQVLAAALAPELTKADHARLVTRAGGLPLDLVKLASQGKSGSPSGLADRAPELPALVLDRWSARLERLGSGAALIRLASACENPFPLALLKKIAPLDPGELQREIKSLVRAGVLTLRETADGVWGEIRQPLLREVAYSSLIRRERQRLHGRLAPLLRAQGVEAMVLAGHLAKAGELGAAAEAYAEAALEARRQGERPQAIAALEEGLRLLRQTPEGGERDRRELVLLTALGPLLSGIRGFDDPTLEELYGRAAELCLRQEDDPEQFAVLRSISAFFVTRARPRKNLPTVEKLLRIAVLAEDDALKLEAHYAAGLTYFALGELASARRHLEAGAELGVTPDAEASVQETGEAPQVACRAIGALVWWLSGDETRAMQRMGEALDVARELSHPNTRAAALVLAAWLHQLRRDPAKVREHAREGLAIARDQGFLVWATQAELLLGWADESRESDAATRLALSLEVYRDNGVLFAQTYLLSLLAEIGAEQRELDLALRYLLEALTAVEVTGEAFWQAELLRLCGSLILISDGAGREPEERLREAESYFQRAVEMARRQGAGSLELRSAQDLAKLWRDRGLDTDADELLADVASRIAYESPADPS